MSKKRAALGKGLSALLSEADDITNSDLFQEDSGQSGSFASGHNRITAEDSAFILEVPVEKISANPFQPRTDFEESALEELSKSIKEFGLIQPITVRRKDDKFIIISGERRFRAAQMAQLEKIPVFIKETDDMGMLEMSIVENIQRQDLNAIETALGFQRLMDECSLTQETMADKVGKKRSTITNFLRLLKLPAEIQVNIRDGNISMGHAKAILSLPEPEAQLSLCEQIIKKGLSVRQAEAKAKAIIEGKKNKEQPNKTELPEAYYKILEIVGKYFHNNISLKRSEKGKGHITIQFANDEEVESFLKAIEGI